MIFIFSGSLFADQIECKLSASTSQNTKHARLNYKFKKVHEDGLFAKLAGSSKLALFAETDSIKELMKALADAVEKNELQTEYVLTPGKWDDMGVSQIIRGVSSRIYKTASGNELILLKNEKGQYVLYFQMFNSLTMASEINLVKGPGIRKALSDWMKKNNYDIRSVQLPVRSKRLLEVEETKINSLQDLAKELLENPEKHYLIYRRTAELGTDFIKLVQSGESNQVMQDGPFRFYLSPSKTTGFDIYFTYHRGDSKHDLFQVNSVASIASLQRALRDRFPNNEFIRDNLMSEKSNIINMEEYSTPAVLDIVNDYVRARQQMKGATAAQRMEVVKSANRYLSYLKNQGKEDLSKSEENHIDLMAKTATKLYKESWTIDGDNATEFAYEMLVLNINSKVMAEFLKKASWDTSDTVDFKLFLNGIFSDIRLRNLEGENIQINESNWKEIYNEYYSYFKQARDVAGFWSSSFTPHIYMYSLLKKGSFTDNLAKAKGLLQEIYDVVSDSDIAGVILLVAKLTDSDTSSESVRKLAENIKTIYKKSDNDRGGSILLGEVMQKNQLEMDLVLEQSSYIYHNAKSANYTTVGEAIHAGAKLKMTLSEIRQAFDEIYDRSYQGTSLTKQELVDMLETVVIRQKYQKVGDARKEIEEIAAEESLEALEEMMEEASDAAINAAIIATIIINSN